jgi:hypothetical protein
MNILHRTTHAHLYRHDAARSSQLDESAQLDGLDVDDALGQRRYADSRIAS